MENNVYDKFERLKAYLKDLGSVAVAFSGGADSAFLLKTAQEVLKDQVIALTAKSASFPERELLKAEEFCKKAGIRQLICESKELELEGFCRNPKNRCYICKKALFEKLKETARLNGMAYVAEGSNLDDTGDYRPGLLAIAELDIKSPLREAGLTKREIRQLSKEMGLPTWNKPSYACLASRFVYGETITKEKLAMVEKAEQKLLNLGFRQMRVRIHGKMARIEVLPEELEKLVCREIREDIVKSFRAYGFTYVTMDLMGYRTGSMNETLSEEEKHYGG